MRLNIMPGFTAESALDSRRSSSLRKRVATDALNHDVVVPQFPWSCLAAFAEQTAACAAGGPADPLCWAAGIHTYAVCHGG